MSDPFLSWHDALEKRHLASLTFQEVRRSVQALSAIYVEQRERIDSNAVFSGAGKRAAFAMFYGPLHFLLVREIVKALGASLRNVKGILDLGCGTGVAGAAWSLEFETHPGLTGVDRNAWALEECRWTYRALHLEGTTRNADVRKFALPPKTGVIAAFTINELDDESRDRLLEHFSANAKQGSPVLIIEPIARRLTRWWDDWAAHFKSNGGREDQWRFHVDLPEKLKLMDRATGLDHRELTARSLWLPGS
jgi:hypothetical protein